MPQANIRGLRHCIPSAVMWPESSQLLAAMGEVGRLDRLREIAHSQIKARASRGQYFRAALFSDPAWDILLELFVAPHEGRRVYISAVGLAADIPLSTALRWVNVLESEGLVEREDDPLDARRTYLRLTEEGGRAMVMYLRSCDE